MGRADGATGLSGETGDAPAPLSWNALASVGLVALAVRLLHLILADRAELFRGLFLDSRYYAEVAQAIRGGAGAGDGPYLLSPLYPYFLALFPSIEGATEVMSAIGIRAVQLVLGAGTCVFAASIADRLAGRRAGWLAGLGAAVYGPLVHFDSAVLVAGPQGFFLTAAVAVAVGRSKNGEDGARRWIAVGLLLGASAALRPTGLVVGAALALCLAVEAALRRRRGEPARVRPIGALVLGLAVAVVPFTVRNVRVGGEAVVLSANGGLNFWAGNHLARANGPLTGPPSPGVFAPPPDYDLATDPVGRSHASKALGREATYAEASRWWWSETLADIRSDPVDWLRLMGRKALLFVHPVEIPQLGSSFEWYRSKAVTLRAPGDARWILLLAGVAPFMLAGVHGRKRLARARYPLVALGSYALVICLFFVNARYRAPVMPTAIALAAAGLVTCAAGFRGPARGVVARLLAGTVALIGASYWVYRENGPLHVPGATGLEERHIGMSLVEEGRFEEAIEVYRSALSRREDARTRANLARALRAAGRIDEAYREYQQVLKARPRDAITLYNLGNLVREDLRRPAEAEGLYRRAVEILPRFAEAHFNLGVVLLDQGKARKAAPSIESALQLAPPGVPWRASAEKAYLLAVRRANERP